MRALGCVGTITDGAIRDLDEMTNAGLYILNTYIYIIRSSISYLPFLLCLYLVVSYIFRVHSMRTPS